MFEWKIAYCEHEKCRSLTVRTAADIERYGFETSQACVPGNFELDLLRAGKIQDPFYSDDTLQLQKLESLHVWYFTQFEAAGEDEFLHFEGVDTIAEIWLNGILVQTNDNMFVGFDVDTGIRKGTNGLVVHILPVCIEARKNGLPPVCNAFIYNYESLRIRKAAHMFGWDIMPRIVSCGIWKPVTLQKKKPDAIRELYFATEKIEGDTAFVNLHLNMELSGDRAADYRVRVHGVCGESTFSCEKILRYTDCMLRFCVKNAKLWEPKNAGIPNLYETTVELFCGETLCDSRRLSVGLRTVELERRDADGANGSGEFRFRVNGKSIFVLGTNWVPLDAFHSNDPNRLEQALELLDDVGCNMVRCWGGNVYESDEFFDFCDRHGILVWQDFAMGCAVYPQDEGFAKQLEKEAVCQIRRLRNHASLALWAGDNECDLAHIDWYGVSLNPNDNILTRKVLKEAVRCHDYSRPYLPSSPYVSEAAYRGHLPLPEDHLWGPRDYFKGDYYKTATCRFASEIGYHGFPSVQSLKQFLRHPEQIFESDGTPTAEYLVHASCMETDGAAPYAYRIRLAWNQVAVLFHHVEEDLADFVKQSQISQAEAKKYFIERFRLGKWERTGIIWWNLIDGWPQISDAVVDYYGRKKLAYGYIRRSQQPVCLMFDEPVENELTLYAVNDLPQDHMLSYRVTDVLSGRMVMSGEVRALADASVRAGSMRIEPDEQTFYLIEWRDGDKRFCNHYFTNLRGIDYRSYLNAAEKCGFLQFEGM